MNAFTIDNLSDPIFHRFIKEVPVGTYLFKQGQPGSSLFIILKGTVRILTERSKSERIVGVLGAGDVLGEKILFSDNPYRRQFAAQVAAPTTLLEIDYENIKVLRERVPDFTEKVLRLVTERLDRANDLVRILQLNDPLVRLGQYLLYFRDNICKGGTVSPGTAMSVEEVYRTLNLEKPFVESCLNDLAQINILTIVKDGFVLAKGKALEEYLPTLRRHLDKQAA